MTTGIASTMRSHNAGSSMIARQGSPSSLCTEQTHAALVRSHVRSAQHAQSMHAREAAFPMHLQL